MSAVAFLSTLTQALFVLIFLIVAVKAVRQPRRANVDTALLFGATALIIAESWVATTLHVRNPNPLVTVAASSLLMALPYLLLRLVDDFAVVPRPLMRGAEVGLAAAVIILFVRPSTPRHPWPLWLTLLYVLYFVGLAIYASGAFVRAARRSSGITRRRMQAVAVGSLCLGLVLVVAGLQAALPALAGWWTALSQILALASGLSYLIGFAPPAWLRRAWQEPEVRAFLSRAARLPRLPDTQAIVRELEHGASTSLGVPHASIGLWDETSQVLWREVEGKRLEGRAGEMIAGQAFATQRPLFWANAAQHDPAHAEQYRAHNAIAVLAVPITAGEKRLGVLTVYAARPSLFAEDDLVLARLLADQAAVILESRALIDEAARVRARDEATRLKDDFLSAAAHDLKTPLTALIAQAQLLEHRGKKDPAAPADMRGIQRMVNEAQRLKRLVTDLLDVSRVEQGKLVGHREMVDIAALARETCARFNSTRHHCLVNADEPVIGEYDSGRILQLLDNLVDNAIKYSPHGGDVCVEVRRSENDVYIAVTDSGIGIPAGDLPYLFDRFHRGTNVDDRRFAGMGLGLFICRGIAEQHGGRLWASSPGPDQGSTFHVVLPATTPAADAVTENSAVAGAPIIAGEGAL